ncbi:hypothetical protein CMV_019904 [Castanea mollissima]|uniref:UBA domain-containing protein n=1 Tax=Castanea mollissima TaxID=60419 RepID=A0A8J4R254_9ROSI|nr:hypothetical protein CMV_019904 [Castanea mollissima]
MENKTKEESCTITIHNNSRFSGAGNSTHFYIKISVLPLPVGDGWVSFSAFCGRKRLLGLGDPAQRAPGKRIRFPKLEPCFAELHSSLRMEPRQPDEQKVQKLVKMGFAEVDVRSALQDSRGDEILAILELCLRQRVRKLVKMGFAEVDVRSALRDSRGDEILAIKMLRLAECAWGGNVTNTKLWQHGEQQVQKLVEMGFAEAAVESALEAVNGDEILAIKMLCFAEFGPAGIDTYRKLWQPDEQQVQKLVEIGFAEAAVRSALEAVNGDEILAIKMLCFVEFGPAAIDKYRMLWQPDEQQVQKLVEMGFAEAAVRSALEAVNGDEILAIKMLRFADCGPAGIDTYRKLWQPDEQQVQKLVEMGFAEAAVRSALEAVNGVEILAIKMLRFAECARAGNVTNTKLWQPDESQVQKLVEMCCDDDAVGRSAVEALVRSALEAVNGDEILAITMLRFVAFAQAWNDIKTKEMQNLVAEAAVEVLLMLFIICLFLVCLLNSETVEAGLFKSDLALVGVLLVLLWGSAREDVEVRVSGGGGFGREE